jgi:AcrR family transcriptional regulator
MCARSPPGPHKLPRQVVRGSQRRQIVQATARLVSEHGYAATRVADIATLAGVSRMTFYEQFANKEQLFRACHQAGSDTQRAQVQAALLETDDPQRQARAAIVSYLGVLEADEDFAQAFFVEAQIATPLIRERFLANQDAYTDLVCEWHLDARAKHPSCRRRRARCGQRSSPTSPVASPSTSAATASAISLTS